MANPIRKKLCLKIIKFLKFLECGKMLTFLWLLFQNVCKNLIIHAVLVNVLLTSKTGWNYVIFDTNDVMHKFFKISLPPIVLDNLFNQNKM